MNKIFFLKLVEKLKGLDYCFFSGIVIYFLTNKKRKFKDIDILINERDIGELAKRLKGNVRKRKINKANLILRDYSINMNFLGQTIEVVTNSPRDNSSSKKIRLVLKNKIKRKFLNKTIYLEPIEELLARKAFFHREKDLNDLYLLKKYKINYRLLKNFSKNWGNQKESFNLLNKIGFNLK